MVDQKLAHQVCACILVTIQNYKCVSVIAGSIPARGIQEEQLHSSQLLLIIGLNKMYKIYTRNFHLLQCVKSLCPYNKVTLEHVYTFLASDRAVAGRDNFLFFFGGGYIHTVYVNLYMYHTVKTIAFKRNSSGRTRIYDYAHPPPNYQSSYGPGERQLKQATFLSTRTSNCRGGR